MRFIMIVFGSIPVDKISEIHTTLTVEAEDTQAWWHYIDNTYILKTTATVSQLHGLIRERFPEMIFCVTQLDVTQMAGYLPKEAWKWVNEHSRPQTVKLKKTTQVPLTDVLNQQRSKDAEEVSQFFEDVSSAQEVYGKDLGEVAEKEE